MAVSVTMPRLGESVSEGTVTRWLKKQGDRVEADEPLLEVSTDKVDTEIPAPASGTLTKITVQEDETVDVGVELAVIGGDGDAGDGGGESAPEQAQDSGEGSPAEARDSDEGSPAEAPAEAPAESADQTSAEPDPEAARETGPAATDQPPERADSATDSPRTADARPAANGEAAGAYVTPLVRKLAAEHDVDLSSVQGTGIGGRIRKQDVLDAAREPHGARSAGASAEPAADQRPGADAPPAADQQPAADARPAADQQPAADARPAADQQPAADARPAADQQPAAGAASESTSAAAPRASQPTPAAPGPQLRGRTEKLSRLRNVIATRMVESLQTSAQLTTVVEADVTRIARLRSLAKAGFEAREGVKLSFLPFFALATVEALRAHPKVNSSLDLEAGTVTYHDAEHLGVAVDTDRGLLVPVIHNSGDLNLGGLARKIADLAERTRGNDVTPDELGGGTFTLTNTGSRGALFDTPIINQPQVGILGTGTVVKRPVVVDDPDLGELIAVRSVVYLALTYDHRIVDGADAARFLLTVKERLEAGDFAAALGL